MSVRRSGCKLEKKGGQGVIIGDYVRPGGVCIWELELQEKMYQEGVVTRLKGT
jgi:hypothetical protein